MFLYEANLWRLCTQIIGVGMTACGINCPVVRNERGGMFQLFKLNVVTCRTLKVLMTCSRDKETPLKVFRMPDKN